MEQHKVILSLAANCDHEKNLAEARHRLSQILSSTHYSTELWTTPIGTVVRTDKYLNQVVLAQTSLDLEQFVAFLKQTEVDMGRTPAERLQGIVRIDLDLMLFDNERYHLRDWERPYFKTGYQELQEQNIEP